MRDLILLRAHTLTYPALRRLADLTVTIPIHLWLVVHHERAPTAVVQLLEALPHEAAALEQLLGHTPELPDPPGDHDIPPGAGLELPYLEPIDSLFEPVPRRRARTAITRELPRRERHAVHHVWDQAYAWTARWINDHGDSSDPDAADAVYALARHGDTASESYLRIRAALDAFDRAGIDTAVDAVDRGVDFGEVRPFEFNAAIARAVALADHTPDPQLAALITLAAIRRTRSARDAPASLWEDPPETTIGDDLNADGRALLQWLRR